VGEDGGDQNRQFDEQVSASGLAGSAKIGVGRLAVHPVLDGIQIELAERLPAKVVNGVHHLTEGVPVVGILYVGDKQVGLLDRPLVEGQQLGLRSRVARGVREEEPERVPDVPVQLADLFEDGVGDRRIVRIVNGGDPEAKDVGAVLVGGVDRLDTVAQALGDLSALAVHDEAVGHDRLVRRAAIEGSG
jgi:hypothetical protein